MTRRPGLTVPVVDYPIDGSVRPVGRFVWEPQEVPLPPAEPSPLLRGRTIAIVGGHDATAASLAAELTDAGAAPVRVPPIAAGTAIGAVQERALAESTAQLRASAGPIDGIIDLNLKDPFATTGPTGWEGPLHQSFALLQSSYSDWAAELDATRIFYLAVTRMGGQMGFAGAPIEQPLGGLWAGLAKGLTREIPNCNVRVLDVGPVDGRDLAGLITRELYRWDLFEVGYRDGRRFTLVALPVEVGPPTLELSPGDVVVISGGGRGIGYALARSLAETHGCRVIISGRAAAPDPAHPVISMDSAAFRELRDGRLRQAAAERRMVPVRAELETLAQARLLARHLAQARAHGHQIEYVQCDVCDRQDVARLITAAGDRLVGVVHNAGVDVPTRLPGKTAGMVTNVVRVKVQGFFNLVDAVRGRPGLAFFGNVGSLTGRLGGMVGQLDYGAANEGLSRCGLWAANSGTDPLPVTTVCWPTWERLGMITNYEATLQYMSAIDVNEGLYHWQRELLSGGTREATFVGEIGAAISPSVLRGYRQNASLPAIDRIVSARFFLGTPLRFQPYRSITSANDLPLTSMPGCGDFRVDGMRALPISLALAYLLSAADWVQPEGLAELELDGVHDVAIELGGLKADSAGQLRLVKEATGRWNEDAWQVSVLLCRDGGSVASAKLVYRPGGPARGAEPDPGDEAAAFLASNVLAPDEPALSLPAGGRLTWLGQVFRLSAWHRHPITCRLWGRADEDRIEDLLTDSPAPRVPLPLNELESILRVAHHRAVSVPGGRANRLTIGRLRFDPAACPAGRLIGDVDGRGWTGFTDDRRRRLRLDDLRFW